MTHSPRASVAGDYAPFAGAAIGQQAGAVTAGVLAGAVATVPALLLRSADRIALAVTDPLRRTKVRWHFVLAVAWRAATLSSSRATHETPVRGSEGRGRGQAEGSAGRPPSHSFSRLLHSSSHSSSDVQLANQLVLYDLIFSRTIWRLYDGAKGLVMWYWHTWPGSSRRPVPAGSAGAVKRPRLGHSRYIGQYPIVTFQYS
jgi:hypothetical protein